MKFKKTSSLKPVGEFQTCQKASLDDGDSSLFKWIATPFSKRRHYKIEKYIDDIFYKNLQNHWAILTKFGSKKI